MTQPQTSVMIQRGEHSSLWQKKKVSKPRTEAVVLATPASHQVLTERQGYQLSPWALTARVNAGPAHEEHAEISGN